ncbi:MAG: YidC/Oxa1 family membrane protein insertase [Lachnospiraceae bacterium]|nr:YidC/Oxa1 family membrane protein insertase [Lachnospiraceae bacterium]
MNLIFLTRVTGILKPFAWVMGMILNAIYKLVAAMGIQNIALCIVIFTIVVKMLMLPLTIKQQKFAKVSALMTPEIKALQEKFRGIDRSDREAMQRYTMEQQEIYQKYGSSPFGGCLPLLIMLPIMFALYRVVYAIPAYVTDVKALYQNVGTEIMQIDDTDHDFTDASITKAIYEFYNAKKVSLRNKKSTDTNFTATDLIDIFSVYNTEVWKDFREGKTIEGENVENWNKLAQSDSFQTIMANRSADIDKILKINSLGSYSILDAPGYKFPAILLPILAFVLQFAQGKLSTTQNKSKDKKEGEQEAMPGMGAMTTILPVMSGIFCVFLPIGVGIYWVVSSGVQIVQQLAINKYLEKYNMEDIVAQNEAKISERNEKYGIYAKGGNGMSTIAKSSTKSIASMDTSKIGSGKGSKSDKSDDSKSGKSGKRSESGRISQEKKDELAKTAAEKGSVGISAIANILKNNEDQ